MNPIHAFFNAQPLTKFINTPTGQTLFSDWFPITDPAKIPELEQLGYKTNVNKTHVRNEIQINSKGR